MKMINNNKSTLILKRLRNIVFNDRLGSYCGAIFFTFWIGQRLYFNYTEHFTFTVGALAWWLITLQFCIFVIAYFTRRKAREQAHGFIEVVFPFFCAGLPFALIMDYPFKPLGYSIASLKPLSTLLIIGGTMVVISGAIFLRKSFSIMTEVRMPVFAGIYGVTRHPMYLGSMATALGTLFQNFGLWNCFIFVVFCICQVYRARREENKIMKTYTDYEDYLKQVGWLWKIGRRRIS
jgi:protein-S-isoprenylcysteine O-methyltransferase Ste14